MDLFGATALVVDANPTTRMTLAGQLRAYGFVSISQASRIADARREIERHPFDLVVCSDAFPRGGSGQALLDDLRRSGLLPYGTIFILITDEATYLKVVEAAESSVDSYIVRPYAAATLYDRIEQARRRKTALWDIHRALEERRYDDAVELCLQRFAARGPQWLTAARWGAEILLRLGRFGQAQALFQSIWDADPQPWALLGVARCQLDSGSPAAALDTLRPLIDANPDYADAYDVRGRAQMELGQFENALESLEQALRVTPLAIGRQQRLGMLAFFLGNRDKAVELLQRAAELGLDSKMFDAESLVLLAIAAHERGDAEAFERQAGELRKRARAAPDDARLQRFVQCVELLALAVRGETGAPLATALTAIAQGVDAPDFDMEAACNLLAVLAALAHRGIATDQAPLVQRLGLRFATSKAMGELLASAASHHTRYAEQLRQCETTMVQRIEQVLRRASEGEAVLALAELYALAQETHNARAVETAWLVLQRYAQDIPNASSWSERVQALRQAYGTARHRPALGDPRLRPAGGVNLGAVDRAASEPAAMPAP
ncbi:tetratricopeptide repeat protein [Tepidimonas taiwanensis]|uniref:Chemotaxis protein CheY n=1 Tax=Tepidimonas taiwanensis TaxID=307486 RepID=A0A554X344_9BURK|nr:tetratricopeptide repeat protein [Tepidimonas taiwanensis]MCX7693646.1 tetratricopeptide repeat protein [Tepidimonas taiwanensis]MDM7462798.1 tetratricopeptide repeat protein [Tepidimonas taiwanensis]TSE30262.1 Chemotaxis protein CheY [Tepidimonas taiwanensis]UBQ04803.1 tetratricopeptide repeat protein [Tepidimonas taiwanensis]